ncbi:MAG: hypothetical protein LBS46_05635 [Dysgonamonadaceae bacterium]|nr:hypothetical protein [Dysgonamonadaceae bacterium]
MEKKLYVSPLVRAYQVDLERWIATTTRSIQYTEIDVYDWDDGNTDNTTSNDLRMY